MCVWGGGGMGGGFLAPRTDLEAWKKNAHNDNDKLFIVQTQVSI